MNKTKTFTLTKKQIEVLQDEFVYALDRLYEEQDNCEDDEVDELDARVTMIKELQKVFK